MTGSPGAEDDLGTFYDRVNDALSEAMGGYLHGGYWDDPVDPDAVEQAADRLTDFVADRLRLAPGQRVLDVGSGNGKATARIAARHGVHLTGITLSPYQVRQSAALAAALGLDGALDFEVHDMMALGFPDASFDAALAIESICHAQSRTEAFAGLARVLRPGGLLVVTDFVLLRPLESEDHRALVAGAIKNYQQGPMLTQEEYEACVRAAGLEVVDFTDIGEHVRPSYQVVGHNLARNGEKLRAHVSEEEFRYMVEDLARFGAITELGYAVVTVRKPDDAAAREGSR
ncbi:SAM-dependent methyltransferase [Kitasatospora sp. NPDC056184]|uniref:SAM-dependent methyltransferase n=1 Tax=Kitasatospora sp. NPDC056184 TaxID=3345738 RepID=UPI0035D7841C